MPGQYVLCHMHECACAHDYLLYATSLFIVCLNRDSKTRGCAAIQARLEAKLHNRRPVASLSGCSLSGHLRRPHSPHSPGPQQHLFLPRVSVQTLLAAILQHCVCTMYVTSIDRFMCSQARQVEYQYHRTCAAYMPTSCRNMLHVTFSSNCHPV